MGKIMRLFNTLALGLSLITGSIYAEGFGFNIGPFSMQFNVGGTYYAQDHKDILDFPLCYAISNLKKVDMVVEAEEKINAKETKFITKRLVVEPHAFGVTKEGHPILRGNIISEKLIKEVTVKYGEDKSSDDTKWAKKEDYFFSGWFKSERDQNIDIQKISNLYVIQESHFDAPKDYKGLKDENIQVICQLPISGQ